MIYRIAKLYIYFFKFQIICVPEEDKGAENLFKEIMMKNFPNMQFQSLTTQNNYFKNIVSKINNKTVKI